MKYIEIGKIKEIAQKGFDRAKACEEYDDDMYETGRADAYEEILHFLESQEQDAPTPPGIEEERKKKGWLDYGLTIEEIGLHRYNAIQRIKEHKDKFKPQNIDGYTLNHMVEYYKAVGAELTLCCLQAWCRDFRFTQEEVKEIIKEEEE